MTKVLQGEVSQAFIDEVKRARRVKSMQHGRGSQKSQGAGLFGLVNLGQFQLGELGYSRKVETSFPQESPGP